MHTWPHDGQLYVHSLMAICLGTLSIPACTVFLKGIYLFSCSYNLIPDFGAGNQFPNGSWNFLMKRFDEKVKAGLHLMVRTAIVTALEDVLSAPCLDSEPQTWGSQIRWARMNLIIYFKNYGNVTQF